MRKLNVKSVQAGQAGICPKCKGKIQVPLESEVDSEGNYLEGFEPPPSVMPQQSTQSSDAMVLDVSRSDGDFLLGKPGTVVHDIGADPIFEAPHRIWHVRDSAMTESGPFKGKKLRKMIDSGLVGANDYVCREDWEDWRIAGDAFPELGPPRSQIPVASDGVFTDSRYEISGAVTAKARKAMRRKRLNLIQIGLCIAGLLIVAALCYLLVKLL